jgi:hypothetical protein
VIARILNRLAPRLYRHDIHGTGGLYLSRYTLARLGVVRVYLNHIHRPDEDDELHNHPWRWALSWILSGGYREERRDGNDVETIDLSAGQFNVILADTFHRIDRVTAPCWTLFVVGERIQDWGFWHRTTGVFTPWRDFIAAKGLPIMEPRKRPGEQ